MFFEERDPIALHTVVAAAHQILTDLGKKKGVASALKDNAYLNEKQRRELRSNVLKAPNFFKHADRDPEATLEFNPETTPFLIFDAILMYGLLSDSILAQAPIFLGWFYVNCPEAVEDDSGHPLLREMFKSAREMRLAFDNSSLTDEQKWKLHKVAALARLPT